MIRASTNSVFVSRLRVCNGIWICGITLGTWLMIIERSCNIVVWCTDADGYCCSFNEGSGVTLWLAQRCHQKLE
ncbi:hypothetical protein ANAPC3_00645 [Anaplasma phagocytophilum]|nr:hypothetical protein ANAPC3_00645 [Anaplasma phagocytophilum]